ncbi:uncharacterized protein LOC5569467 [Aedes aegypti]|uniref:Uncharacterized protein n=1 Tax=Aedes aegypti TaxID=7159 RepID=A0A1S4FH45_AEDAE|nr:uncharacterized protein LOC5569467 [Aedes aegypti]
MEDQSGCFEQVLQDFHKNENHIRLISQEPERLDDEGFVQICLSCESVGIGELPSALQPLMERLLATSDGASDGQMLPDVMEERGSILKETVAEILDRIDEFNTLDQYIWLVKFSCGLCLLKNLPIGMSFEINKVIRSVAGLDTEQYEFCPVTIHTISKSLFEDIPLKGMNLVHVIKKLTVLNQKLFYYVSITLVFAGIRHYSAPAESIAMYRLFGFDDVLSQLGALKLDCIKQKRDMRAFFLILKLLSSYQNAAILRHSLCSWEDLQEQHKGFAEFFRITVEQKKAFIQWLVKARNIVSNVNSQSGMQDIGLKEDLMLVTELIDLDMIALMEDDIEEESH